MVVTLMMLLISKGHHAAYCCQSGTSKDIYKGDQYCIFPGHRSRRRSSPDSISLSIFITACCLECSCSCPIGDSAPGTVAGSYRSFLTSSSATKSKYSSGARSGRCFQAVDHKRRRFSRVSTRKCDEVQVGYVSYIP